MERNSFFSFSSDINTVSQSRASQVKTQVWFGFLWLSILVGSCIGDSRGSSAVILVPGKQDEVTRMGSDIDIRLGDSQLWGHASN